MPTLKRSTLRLLAGIVCLFASLGGDFVYAQSQKPRAAEFDAPANPVLLGDHPDPTIIRVGKTYWTASTSGNWAPEFPLFKSTDLKHWTPAGSIFPRTPTWASGDFWAPELVEDNGRTVAYYVARKRGGPLCVAAATAPAPGGPFHDEGPILCQPDGSIDPSFVRDEHQTPYLIWKEDANSIGKPTPIWAQPLRADLLHLTGEKTKLIENDPASWEGGVVEGPYILRHAGSFYLFYAGSSCCGTECHYAEGVARADHLLGPWQKDPANPIIVPNGEWKCPGHGTAVEDPAGKTYFIYHAYPATGTIYLGRETLLDRVDWEASGWPVVNSGKGPSGTSAVLPDSLRASFSDSFAHNTLDASWRWPVGYDPVFHVGEGGLILDASTNGDPVFLARSLTSPDFVATVRVGDSSAAAGLGVIGGVKTKIVLARNGAQLELTQDTDGHREILWTSEPALAARVWLRVAAGVAPASGPSVNFSYSMDGKAWTSIPATPSIAHMPAWDQGLRVGLLVTGPAGSYGTFEDFSLNSTAR